MASQPINFTAGEFVDLAGERLLPKPMARFLVGDTNAQALKAGPSDYDLNPGLRAAIHGQMENDVLLRPAAVLVPIVARRELNVIFTRRTDGLPTHAGQISFPGGKVDAGDANAEGTAAREAHEEIGLTPDSFQTLGYLDPYETATGYEIQPVVGLIDQAFEATANPSEVAEVFEVPLEFFLNPENHQRHSRLYREKMRSFYAMPYADYYIWGATAGILKNLYQRLIAT